MPLRSLRASDVLSIMDWVPATASGLRCEHWQSEDELRGAMARDDVVLYHDGAGEAFVVYNVDAPRRGDVRIELLAVPPGKRRLGIGGRAAVALEKRIARTSKRIYVALPATIGLALYFWLRLGYRPLTQREWPSAKSDLPVAWVMRELR